MANEPSTDFKDFSGINNVDPQERLGAGELREAVNVNISRSKRVARRDGFALQTAGNYHSLFSATTSGGEVMLGVSGSNLVRFSTGLVETVLLAVNPALRWSFVEVNGIIYGTNGAVNGLYSGSAWKPWGIAPMAAFPTLTFGAGAFPAGKYHFAITYKTATGLESQPVLGSYTAATAGGFTLSAMPASTHPDVTKIAVYMTHCNGSEYYFSVEVNNNVSTVALVDTVNAIPLRTQYLSAPPVGTMLRYHYGRIYIVDSQIVWFTDYQDYEHIDYRKNFVVFTLPVTVLESVQGQAGTLWAVSDRTYALVGQQPEQFNRIVADDSGDGVKHSGVVVPANRLPVEGQQGQAAVWIAGGSVCAGFDNGFFQSLTPKYIAPSATEGAAVARDYDGLYQYLAVLKNPSSAREGAYVSDMTAAATVQAF